MNSVTPNWIAIIVSILGGIGTIAAILGWWISKFLADKKDIITCIIKIEDLERRMSEVQADIKDLERK